MHCVNCGCLVKESYKFCANCGESIILPDISEPSDELNTQTESNPTEASYDIPLPDCPPEFQSKPVYSMHATIYDDDNCEYTEEFQSNVRPINDISNLQNKKTEKFFFGKKALFFCLTIIAILSVTTGMFIGLYFDERNRKTSSSQSGGLSYSQYK